MKTRSRVSRLFLSVTALAAAALSVAGCSGGSVDPIKPTNSPTKTSSPTNTPSPTSPAGGDLSGACAKVAPASGSALPVCTALYTDGTALRLPKGTSGQSYGGFTRAGTGFATADGTTLHVEDDVRQKAAASDSAGYADYGSTVYRATVSGHQVTALTPVLRIDRDALVRSVFAGTTMVGKIAPVDLPADAAEPSYSGEPSLPVVINWSDASSDGQLTGVIANATVSVSAGGTCAPALTSSPANPLVGTFTARVGLLPYPSMHAAWDDELVLTWSSSSSGMGSAYYPSVATLMGADPLQGQWDVMQHGTPTSGPSLALTMAPKGTTIASC